MQQTNTFNESRLQNLQKSKLNVHEASIKAQTTTKS